jgi:hypothetical protein
VCIVNVCVSYNRIHSPLRGRIETKISRWLTEDLNAGDKGVIFSPGVLRFNYVYHILGRLVFALRLDTVNRLTG